MEGPGAAREVRTAVLAASDPCRAIRLWKALTGRKAVGCPPFFPVPEILHAVGMLPVFAGPGDVLRMLAPLMDERARIPEPFPEDLEGALDWVESVAEWAGEVSGGNCTDGALERSMRLYRERDALVLLLEARCAGPGGLLEAEALRAVVESGRFLPVEAHSMLLEGILGEGPPEAAGAEADRGDPLLRLARRARAGTERRKASGGSERRTGP